jgi:hypothetical protein
MKSLTTALRNLRKAKADYSLADTAAQDAIDRRVDTTPSLAARGRAQRSVWIAEEHVAAARAARAASNL